MKPTKPQLHARADGVARQAAEDFAGAGADVARERRRLKVDQRRVHNARHHLPREGQRLLLATTGLRVPNVAAVEWKKKHEIKHTLMAIRRLMIINNGTYSIP
jgi:hypothetical protein